APSKHTPPPPRPRPPILAQAKRLRTRARRQRRRPQRRRPQIRVSLPIPARPRSKFEVRRSAEAVGTTTDRRLRIFRFPTGSTECCFVVEGICFNKQRNADMAQGISTIRTPASRPTSDLSRETLLRMANAGVKVVARIADLHARGSNLVIEVLRGSGDFIQWEHYPSDDVRDPKSHAQYYFHAHPPDERDDPDYGHFHLFVGSQGVPASSRHAKVGNLAASASDKDAPSHLIAISMTPA